MNIAEDAKAGKRVHAARLRLGMAQEELADAADLSVQYLSHIENARSKASLTTFMKLANALQMTLNDFFCDSLEASCGVFEKQIEQILKDCTASETRFIAKMLTDMKETLREYERSARRTM
jgi:transcriptional regulator with XRE-family HTH domain